MGELQRKFEKARALGLGPAVRIIIKKLPHYLLFPQWMLFRMRHADRSAVTSLLCPPEEISGQLEKKERLLREILSAHEGGSFLEIGIGPSPNLERVKFMGEFGVSYTACDFQMVCDHHCSELERQGVDVSRIMFASNRVGTYSWTLFEMLQRGKQFDIIYLDGHHTFYVDLPALSLAHYLLKPGGVFVVDDIVWSLDFLTANMYRSFDEWHFYRKIYNFGDYSAEQRGLPHMKMVVEELLLGRLHYLRDEVYCLPEWWALRKPQGGEQAQVAVVEIVTLGKV